MQKPFHAKCQYALNIQITMSKYVQRYTSKLAVFNCSWQSNKGMFRAQEMVGIEPTAVPRRPSKDLTEPSFRLSQLRGCAQIYAKEYAKKGNSTSTS